MILGFLIYENKMLLFYSVCWCCLCVSSFGEFPVFSVSCLIHDFYANIPDFYANILCGLGFYVLYRAWCAVGGVPVWLGGICSLVHVFTWACILTCQPDSQVRIPVRIPFLQGTGGASSADHPWVGTHNGNFDDSVYPLPYFRKGLLPFFCHDSTQLREHD